MHPRCRHLWQLIGILAMIALVLGVGLERARAQEGAAAVSIVDFAFDPAAVEIPVGATVTWTNTGAAPHTATASDGTFDSGQLAPGATFSHTFTAAGTFPYVCQIHPQMTGTVTVVDAAAAAQGDEAEQPRRRERATPAAADGQDAQGGGAEPAQVPRTGVGTMVLAERSGGLALLAGLAAVVLGAGAVVAYRRS
jgi:plastocyanin